MLEFHVQQAIEKLLKALIAAHGEKYPNTHDLQVLLGQLKSLGEVLPDFGIPLIAFTKFGVLSRYDLGVGLNEQQRQAYRKVVADLRSFVKERIDLLP